MESSQNDGASKDGAFPVTAWSLVARAASSSPEEKSAALQSLLKRYIPALRVRLIVEKKLDEHRAEEILQDFVTHKILEQQLIAQADRAKGKFRTFVLTALDRFVIDCVRYEAAAKRSGPRAGPSSMETVAADDPEPSAAFDVQWARDVIDQAAWRMQAQCADNGRPELWELFSCRILAPALDGSAPEAYDRIIERFGFSSPAVASNALVTAKRMFERSLRSVVGEYTSDEREIDREIADLRRAVR
jgi:RNA polymerase sigma-70 factor (ECF subfamily)